MQLTETQIRNSIINYLRFKGINCWANNTTGTYDKNRNTYITLSKYHALGASDILGIINKNGCGKFLAIEVKKSAKEKLLPNQREFIKNVNKDGGIGFVAYDVKSVAKKLDRWF